MIRVDPQPEPASFDAKVRQPGKRFLKTTPNPTEAEWRGHAYWRQCARELHQAYRGICAYSCHWIPLDTGFSSVDHFKPKKQFPRQAYEWNNYRLASGILNGRKGDRNVLDPFEIEDGWFVLEFPSLLVKPEASLPPERLAQVALTCEVLLLNDEATCLKNRVRYVEDYCKGEISYGYLESNAPFIARELERQGLKSAIIDMWRGRGRPKRATGTPAA